MDQDFYKTLEVSRGVSQADIQKAYRELARKYHPDLNPDDKRAKAKFQEVQRAFEVLNDPEKRELYDRYGSSFESAGGGGPGGAAWAPGGQGMDDIDLGQFFGEKYGGGGGGSGAGAGGFADIFKQFSGGGGGGPSPFQQQQQARPRRGQDILHEVKIPFRLAVTGGQIELTVERAAGKTEKIAVKVPAGIEDGKKIRLRSQGKAGARRGTAGDLIITVRVESHSCYTRRGNRLDVTVPVSLVEAAEGAKVDVPMPAGTITITIPPGTSSGSKLRLKGCGVKPTSGVAGDLFAEIQIMLPKAIDEASLALVREFEERNPISPRENLEW